MDEHIGEKINIARQPIYDKNMEVFAYELLYRPTDEKKQNKAYSESEKKDDEYTSIKVIANAQLMGLYNITEGKKAFINFGTQLLLNKIPTFFSNKSIGIEILESVVPEPELIKSCIEMKFKGYTIILDDFIYNEHLEDFVEIADIIKIDFLATTIEQRKQTMESGRKYRMKYLAEKIEDKEQYDLAVNEGFDYFQGYYFNKPDILSIPAIPGYKINYLNILKIINKPVLNIEELEKILKREISLTYRLLIIINKLSKGQKKVKSIKDALETFEWGNLKNWLSLIVLSSVGHDKPQKLLNNTLIRAKFFELIAINTGLSKEKENYFMIGMISMLDLFLKQPIEKILHDLPLEEEVKDALLGKKNKYFNLIMLVNSYENENNSISELAEKIGISKEKLSEIYISAIESGNLHY